MNTVRGQYDAGSVSGLRGDPYRREPMSRGQPHRNLCGLKLMIDNWRWSGCRSTSARGRRWPRGA